MNKLSGYVGNTPLIPITLGNFTVWGKAEFMNPGGSVKDRMATHILNNAEKFELIKKETHYVKQHQVILVLLLLC